MTNHNNDHEELARTIEEIRERRERQQEIARRKLKAKGTIAQHEATEQQRAILWLWERMSVEAGNWAYRPSVVEFVEQHLVTGQDILLDTPVSASVSSRDFGPYKTAAQIVGERFLGRRVLRRLALGALGIPLALGVLVGGVKAYETVSPESLLPAPAWNAAEAGSTFLLFGSLGLGGSAFATMIYIAFDVGGKLKRFATYAEVPAKSVVNLLPSDHRDGKLANLIASLNTLELTPMFVVQLSPEDKPERVTVALSCRYRPRATER